MQDEVKVETQNQREESLNSDDDDSDYDESINTGNNILLGYYEKTSRKRNKRKITLRHCILRVEGIDLLIPFAKGNFNWIGKRS